MKPALIALALIALADFVQAQTTTKTPAGGARTSLRITKSSDGDVTLNSLAIRHRAPQIWASEDLQTWRYLGTASITEEGTFTLSDIEPSDASQCYYVAMIDESPESSQRSSISGDADRQPDFVGLSDPPVPCPGVAGGTSSGGVTISGNGSITSSGPMGGSSSSGGGLVASSSMGSAAHVKVCPKVTAEGNNTLHPSY